MLWVGVFLVVGLALAVGAVFVVREAGRLTHEPPPVLFSLDEAFDWVVERVPDEVAATLTPADVRRILAFQTEYLAQRGVAENGTAHASPGPQVVVVGPDVVDYILGRAAATGEAYIPEQVYPVIEVQFEYLRAIGAVSTPVEGPLDPEFDDGDGAGQDPD